jgi:hypothetical protein
VLLHGHRVVRAALHRCVVGDDDAGCALDLTDAGHHPGSGRVPVVQTVGRQGGELEERGTRVDEPVDPFADRKLAALAMAGDRAIVARGAALRQLPRAAAEVLHQAPHRFRVRLGGWRGKVEGRAQDGHEPIMA